MKTIIALLLFIMIMMGCKKQYEFTYTWKNVSNDTVWISVYNRPYNHNITSFAPGMVISLPDKDNDPESYYEVSYNLYYWTPVRYATGIYNEVK